MVMTKPTEQGVVGGAAPSGAPVTIARERYTSPDVHRLELERMWPRVWQMAGRVDDVAEAGDFVEYSIGDQSVLVIRGKDGLLRAFRNTCLHRGNQLRSETGNVGGEIRCRYHLWAWNLDGSLKDVPDRDGFGSLDESAYCLPQVAVDTWGGFVFVNLDPDAEPLLDFLGELPAQLDPYHFEQMICTFDATTVISANWKVVVEAFLEVYHVQGIHPQLLPIMDDRGTTYDNFTTHSRMIVPFGIPSARIGPVPPKEIFEGFVRVMADSNVMASGEASGGLMNLFGPDTTFEPPEGMTVRSFMIQMVRMMGEGRGVDFSGLSDDQMIDDWHYHIFPNLVFNTHAGGFLFFRVRPSDDPHSCLFDIMTFEAIPDEKEAAERKATHAFYAEGARSFGETIDQDLENLPGVQKGLRNEGPKGVVTISDQETRIAHMHRVIDRYLDGE